jgi:glucose/arabinose dehydrogenase
MATRTGDPALYVAEQGGRVVALGADGAEPRLVLDLTGRTDAAGEQGLLGLAFAPDGAALYVNYTDRSGDTTIEGFTMADERAVPRSRRLVLAVDQPYANHNGGNLAFGPDGYLYVGLGDGGGAGDPLGNGQSLGTLLGKMLRIDPASAGAAPYTVPTDNPFVDDPGARPEIWAYGLRNPWRYSFDRVTGDLWIGDVGQSDREEIDLQPAASTGGENYGWSIVEGTEPFQGDPTDALLPPVYDYGHEGGECAVTGGYVYRGSAIPALAGTYLFADVCVGSIETLRIDGDRAVPGSLGLQVAGPASFGEDQRGELYVLSLEGGVYRLVPD